MSLDLCCGFLEALALLNDGVNHGSSYTIERLPAAATLDASLALYFAAIHTSIAAPQPAEHWGIRAADIADDWAQVLQKSFRRWFFEQEYSPTIDPHIADNVVSQFLQYLRSTVGDAKAFRVTVEPPLWYECVWEDFAFGSRSGAERWLLHFGFSD